MWLANQDGFFSIVKKGSNSDNPICVRSRIKQDLINYLTRINAQDKYSILENAATDYQFRAFISLNDFKEYQSKIAEALDYDNFKASLPSSEEHCPNRHDIYFKVWMAVSKLVD